MVEQTETIELDDSAIFQEAVADEPKEVARDEQGRFAKADEKPAEVVEAKPEAKPEPEIKPEAKTEQLQGETKDDAQVPSWRLREVREAREAAERRAEDALRERSTLQSQMQALQNELNQLKQPKAEPVDFFADPDQALQQRLTPTEDRLAKLEQDVRLNISRMTAISVHGAPAVQEMEAAIEKAIQANHPDMHGLAAQMRASSDPAAVAMNWHRRSKLWDATNGDIDGYKNKVREEALKDPEYLAKALEIARSQAGQSASPKISLPPSLNKTAGASMSASDDGDMSDRGIFKHALSR